MRSIEKAILNRTALLLGDAAMERVSAARVFIFGVGGVGSCEGRRPKGTPAGD